MKYLYLDLYFFLNLLVDYLICLSAGRLCSLRLQRKRYLLAAFFGAAYAILQILSDLPFFTSLPGMVVSALVMAALAFGGEAKALRCLLVMLAIAALFGGVMTACTQARGSVVAPSIRMMLAVFLFCYGILKLLLYTKSRWDGQKKAQIRLQFSGREAVFDALVDSGNSLRCPDTGVRAMIVSPPALHPVFLEDTVCLEELSPIDLVAALSENPKFAGRLRLIPFRSLGGSGLVPVFRPEHIWVNGIETKDLLVAISREARGNGFEAIL